MKKWLSGFLCFVMICGCFSSALAIDLSFIDELELEELEEIKYIVDDRIKELKLQTATGEEVEATRTNPAPLGARFIGEVSSYSENSVFAITLTRAIRGESAKLIAKSFNSYNTRSLEKGEEWFLAMVRIEAISSDEDKIDFSDYRFSFVSKDGVEYQSAYIADNPLEVKPLYVGAEQYAWLACKIKEGDMPYITYEDYGMDTAWFNPNNRLIVDTSSETYEPLKSGSKGKEVEELQYRLAELDLLRIAPDGKYGTETSSAVRKYQKAMELENTGVADEETLRLIMSGAPLKNE